jgi:uncharacterized protein YecE (DUF72 family)
MIYVGTAAWSIPKIAMDSFPLEGTHLERYSKVLSAVEINSSFYKDHQAKSYKRWAACTPESFRFSVKLNKRFTHEGDLEIDCDDLRDNLRAIMELGEKMGVLLIQFAAGKKFNYERMRIFYKTIRDIYPGPVALEARNMTWMSNESIELMKEFNLSKADADPEKCAITIPGQIKYYRLHGSPEIYKSNYESDYLDHLYDEMTNLTGDVWCIFDNTTFGYATENALAIIQKGEHNERYPRHHEHSASAMYTAY